MASLVNPGAQLASPAGSSWEVEIDRATAADWSRMLDLFDDANIYQTWAYGSVHWSEKELSHLVLRRDGEIVAIAQLRIVRPTRLKFGMGYLRWGPLCQRRGRALDPGIIGRMARALEDEYVRNRKLLLRIIPSSFIGTARGAAVEAAFGGYASETPDANNTYRTFVLDLAPEVEELRRRLDKKWRNQLSRAEKNNLTVIAGNGCSEYRTFCTMYHQMLSRKMFDTTVDVEEFGRMQQELPERQRMRVLICEDGGRPVAGLVASTIGDTAIYLLGATSNEGLNSKGAYLLQWTLIKSLKESGIKWYDLGGIDPVRNPGVYHFKRGLSGVDSVQLTPFIACTSTMSSTVVKTGVAIRDAVRSCKLAFRGGSTLRPQFSQD